MKQYLINETAYEKILNVLSLRFVCDTDINLYDGDSDCTVNLESVLEDLADSMATVSPVNDETVDSVYEDLMKDFEGEEFKTPEDCMCFASDILGELQECGVINEAEANAVAQRLIKAVAK